MSIKKTEAAENHSMGSKHSNAMQMEDQLNRMSNYLERLSLESEQLEKDLKEKKIRRLQRQAEELESQSGNTEQIIQSISYGKHETLRADMKAASIKLSEITTDMAGVKGDLTAVLNELLSFKKARNQLETRILQNS